jgi:hypothetical protein
MPALAPPLLAYANLGPMASRSSVLDLRGRKPDPFWG